MAIQKLKPSDFQFGDEYDPRLLRRLNDELRSVSRAINQVIDTLGEAESGGGAFQHVLATTAGLGDAHVVTELQVGMVLTAIADDNAAFRFLGLDDLADVTVDSAQEGDVLIRSGAQWVAQTLPGLSGLADPGADYIVYWNEDADDLDYLQLGTGLVIAGGLLVLDTSAIDHGSLFGLGDDDHPQYPLSASPETISGDWTFTGELLFERATISLLFSESDVGADDRYWLLTIDDGELNLTASDSVGTLGESILRVDRNGLFTDSIALGDYITLNKNGASGFNQVEYGAYELAALHSFYGDVQILDDGTLAIGEAGEISLRFDETDSFITTAGDVYWENTPAGDLGATLNLAFEYLALRAGVTEFILDAVESNENERAWGQRAEFGLLQLAALNDDGSIGEAWASVTSDAGSVDEIALNGASLTFNGERVLTESDLP